ncbi:MAG TPA: chemotaxis protein CheW [Pirellulales bacterium]|nr:chemotaxis protein CheW [Pirellulales bacterium]
MLALSFQIDDSRLALDVRRVSLVVPRVPLEKVAGAPSWLAGVFVYAQTVVPVVDVHCLLGAGACPEQLSSRIILVPWPEADSSHRWLGLLAAQVSGIRDLPETASVAENAAERAEWGKPVLDGGKIIRLVDLERLLSPSMREQLAGVFAA